MNDLTQVEADALLATEKRRLTDDEYNLSAISTLTVPLISHDGREQFLLDISRGRINLLKGKYQSRARKTVVLARIDFGGAPHRNPDDEEIPCPHLHLYREGYGTKWARALPVEAFSSPTDPWQILQDFFLFCNVTEPPKFNKGLFS